MTIAGETNNGVKCVGLPEVVKIDEGKVVRRVEEVARQSVEQPHNGQLEAEADERCGAKRYQRRVERVAPPCADEPILVDTWVTAC